MTFRLPRAYDFVEKAKFVWFSPKVKTNCMKSYYCRKQSIVLNSHHFIAGLGGRPTAIDAPSADDTTSTVVGGSIAEVAVPTN